MALPITYKYEVYRQGTYLGILPKVTSEFNFSQDINSGGSQIVITTAQDVDTQQLSVSLLTDESGNQLTDESSNNLTTSRASDIYGNNIFSSMIQDGNEIRVTEYTQWQPNGVIVFDGLIKRWNPHIGSGDSVDLTVLSYGVELDNDILYGSVSIDQAVTSVDTEGNYIILNNTFPLKGAQTFTTGPEITNIEAILVQCPTGVFGAVNSGGTITATLYTYTGGNPDSGTLLGSGSATAVGSGNFQSTPFTAIGIGSIDVTPSTQYAVVFTTTAFDIFITQSNSSYTGGSSWSYGSPTSGVWTQSTQSLVFMTLAANEGDYTNTVYFHTDPVGMLLEFLSNYHTTRHGHIGEGTITTSNVKATYQFVLNTVLEGIQACLSMAPSGYFWYVDPGANALSFKPKSATPDHVFTMKVHLNTVELIVTSETTINAAYLTAGSDFNGNTILVYAENSMSITNFGRVLDRITDSRIVDGDTAQLIVNNYVDTNSVENYETTVIILASVYDLTLLKWGDVIGFNGSNGYIDTLQMQIVTIERHEDYAQLTLGTIPRRASAKVEEIQRSLLSSQTVSNPLSAI